VVVLVGDSKAFLFDTVTGVFSRFEPEGVDWGAFSFESSRCADGVVRLAFEEKIVNVGLSSVETVDLPPIQWIAAGNGGLAVDTAGGVVAVVSAAELPPGDPTVPDIQDIVAATLVLVDRATGTRQEVDLGVQLNDFYVSVSPDGGKVAVCDDYFVSVYDTATAKLLYSVGGSVDAIYWLSNDTFVHEGGMFTSVLYVANVTNRESRGITDKSSQIGVSSTTAVVDGYLYFMGFAQDADEPGHGYRVSVP
jgi:hypothetical protein